MNNEKVVYISSQEELDNFKENESHILYFSSKDCNVCHSVFPKMMDSIGTYPITVGRIDVNEQLRIAGQHLIFSIPTILVFNEGQEVFRESRFINFGNFERLLSILFD